MCGIVGGYWKGAEQGVEGRLDAALRRMHHRGPDDKGFELNNASNGIVALGHTRLSIIDLSSAGHQPMYSRDGRYAIVFNGEIYNYRELREELRTTGVQFHSDSDTEVLLQAWIAWGERCLPRLQGMFAFVIHDRHAETLTCVRDAFGIKPFFYTWSPGRFAFASELPALLALLPNKPKIDWQRSYDYLVNADYDSQARTFVEGTYHLPPAHMMVLDLKSGMLAEPAPWWRPSPVQTSSLTFAQATEAVREQFLDNVRLHLRSDVPLGAALSGGIDSSAVVCAMRHVDPESPIHTFSFIADGSPLSEEHWVDQINAHVGATPHKFVATGDELVRDLDDMIRVQGEPFGSTSIYAQYRVFQKAKESGITVTLDGQGADELLAGYSGYPGLRLLSLLESGQFGEAMGFARRWSQWPGRRQRHAWMHLMQLVMPDGLYDMAKGTMGNSNSPAWLKADMLRESGVNLRETRHGIRQDGRGRRVIERLLSSLRHRGLPELLRHADRNSMRFSVESRVPFLTLPMAELLLGLPEHYLISPAGETKSVFRAAMRGIVPDHVLDRKDKIGFATPEKEWLMNVSPMIREWLRSSEDIPFLQHARLLESFDEIMAGRRPFSWQVWRWVNYCRWYQMVN
ncbi:asparagine synthase (glutamine-hydrolyzing) [Pseudomonas sp. BN102]|uniref:asparagine synthase (glutamine-hydrolyzing) n=1 Tax=Pseudomonas sp. BN102 TaxID=2567886 RepID=UPI0024542471|nr:asparagine synthase (glutamine-hydrolyzing) [Pseudomonas sp. BN102]MDH4607312.1 asparagine synthase (glutamine-hydrolyzing) [Pseudomonas sp. BN102]